MFLTLIENAEINFLKLIIAQYTLLLCYNIGEVVNIGLLFSESRWTDSIGSSIGLHSLYSSCRLAGNEGPDSFFLLLRLSIVMTSIIPFPSLGNLISVLLAFFK